MLYLSLLQSSVLFAEEGGRRNLPLQERQALCIGWDSLGLAPGICVKPSGEQA